MINTGKIYRARKQILPYTTRTLLIPAASLGTREHEVRLKLETTQPTGAAGARVACRVVAIDHYTD